jgi:hypothetical protein
MTTRGKSWEFVATTVEVDDHRMEILGIYSSRTMQVDLGQMFGVKAVRV